ncbi:MAG: hypothetical protein FWE95_11005 [Planctomycetaceae bacterium]|nr:hypothetical protein [Planctomycetaceae bacterium]
MKRLLLIIAFLCSPAFAEELPILWLEAGKEQEVQWIHPGPAQNWTLRFEHRTLDSGNLLILAQAATIGHRSLTVKTPPVRPGIFLQAQLFFGDQHAVNVVIASPDPFEDRKEWFDKHPIALYDPEKTTTEFFEEQEIPFQHLRSFADIEAVKDAVIVVGQGVDFEREKGLAELLFQKAAAGGGSVLIVEPKGDFPLTFHPAIHSLKLLDHRREILPNSSRWGRGDAWTLQSEQGRIVLSPKLIYPTNIPGPAKIGTVGPKILDVVFTIQERTSDFDVGRPVPKGRLYIDRDPIFQYGHVESRWYFKSLIETLTEKAQR